MTAPPPPPPLTATEPVTDVLHGVEVADPYRWLEDPTDPRRGPWLAAQRAATEPMLAALPDRAAFRARLAALWSVPRRGVPWRRGERWFQLRNDGRQDQDVLWSALGTPWDLGAPARADHAAPEHGWEAVLDPNAWTPDGTASLGGLSVADDGRRVAYGRSDAGSDWVTWRVLEVDPDGTVTHLDDRVAWAKVGGATWLPGGRSFLYGAYDPPPDGHETTATTRAQRLQRHHVGTDAADDDIVHDRPDEPDVFAFPQRLHGDGWLALSRWRGTARTNRLDVIPIGADGDGEEVRLGAPVALFGDRDARYEPVDAIEVDGATWLLVITDRDAPSGRVVAIDPADPGGWRELVSAGGDRLLAAHMVGGATPQEPGWLVVSWLHHATSRLTVHDARTGAHLHDVTLPGLSTVTAISGGREDGAVHLSVGSFTLADEVWRHDLAERRTTRVVASSVPAPTHPVVTEQVLVHHRDEAGEGPLGPTDEDGQVAVPVFVIHRADVVPSGEAATVLWGYGGFDVPVTPTFRPAWRAWVDAGGVLAVACLRGGGEYGRGWHQAGSVERRPAVQADALAVARWLTGRAEGQGRATIGPAHDGVPVDRAGGPEAVWSAPHHLGIEGRSNGGLLVGACVTAAPELFGSAVPEVGVLDLLRFHRFTIGWAWVSDYGSPDDPAGFPVLHALSPYHRVLRGAGVAYPPTLITTADTDDRVVPAHSFKFAAALQAGQTGPAPVRLRVDSAAGHGAGKPVAQMLEERSDVLAWHAYHLGGLGR